MTRRELLACSLAIHGTARAQSKGAQSKGAQSAPPPLKGTTPPQSKYPGVVYREYSRCLPDFLRDLAQSAYELRNAELAKLNSTEAITRRQQWVRSTFWNLVGGQPERTPLRPRTIDSLERNGYRIEKIVYESQPGFIIPANLYVPSTGSPPYPGVLFQMGHSLNGKTNDGYQKCCQGLARLGYVVLAFDPMGQGERVYYPGPSGVTRLGSADDEHTYPGKQMLLAGGTATRFQVWDAVRSLDYLAQRPEVDPKRLTSTGQSGGGTLTMLLAAVDSRLAAAAVASGNTENFACANFNPPGSTDDAEQDFIGSGTVGFDRWDLLYPIAPKPLLIMVSARDFFGTYSPRYLSNGWEEYQKLERIYSVLGHKEQLAWADTPLPHGLTYSLRLHIYNWFERWLKGSERRIDREPEVAPEPDPRIWVGPTGNVMRDFASTTPFRLLRERASRIQTPAPDPHQIRKALAIPAAQPRGAMTRLGKVPSGPLMVEAIEVASAKNVWVPAWLFTPPKVDQSKSIILFIDEHGRNLLWREGGLAERLASNGRVVCAADVRGIGDLRPEPGRGAAGYSISHAGEEHYSWASLILGRPLLGQRVTDLLAMLEALRPLGNVALVANGRLTVPALIAAALDHRVPAVYLSSGLVSLRRVVESETYQCPLANIVPNLLASADLPQFAAMIAPRRVYLAGTVDAAGKRMDADAVKRLYPYTHASVSQDPEWTAEVLLAL